jgi:hypothetical protein
MVGHQVGAAEDQLSRHQERDQPREIHVAPHLHRAVSTEMLSAVDRPESPRPVTSLANVKTRSTMAVSAVAPATTPVRRRRRTSLSSSSRGVLTIAG